MTKFFSDGFQEMVCFLWIIVCPIFGYFISGVILYSRDLPSEEKYQVYESIIKQAYEIPLNVAMNIELPENTSLSITKNAITLSNNVSRYSVQGTLAPNKLIFNRESGQAFRFLTQIGSGAVLIGFITWVTSALILGLFSTVIKFISRKSSE